MACTWVIKSIIISMMCLVTMVFCYYWDFETAAPSIDPDTMKLLASRWTDVIRGEKEAAIAEQQLQDQQYADLWKSFKEKRLV